MFTFIYEAFALFLSALLSGSSRPGGHRDY